MYGKILSKVGQSPESSLKKATRGFVRRDRSGVENVFVQAVIGFLHSRKWRGYVQADVAGTSEEAAILPANAHIPSGFEQLVQRNALMLTVRHGVKSCVSENRQSQEDALRKLRRQGDPLPAAGPEGRGGMHTNGVNAVLAGGTFYGQGSAGSPV